MKTNNKRGKYNENYNLEALEKLHLIMEDKDYWMTSLQLAEVSGRRHSHVLEDIRRDLISRNEELLAFLNEKSNETKSRFIIKETLRNDISKFKYKETFYFDERNRKKKLYLLNRESSLLCLSRYHHIIKVRVNSLFLDLYDKEIERIKKKAESYDKVINGSGTLSVGTVAKSLNIKDTNGNSIGRNKLFEILRNNKVLQSSKSDWNIPYQNYIKNGYFRTLLSKTVNGITVATTRITPKGFEFIENLCNILGYVYDGNLEDLRIFVSNDDYSDEESDFYK